MKYSAVVVAAGSSERFAGNTNKLLYRLPNKCLVIDQTLKLFREDKDCCQIVIVVNQEVKEHLIDCLIEKEELVDGGSTRSQSVYNGLLKVKEEVVLVHDGARCYLEKNDLENLKESLDNQQAALLVKPAVDTLKEVRNGYLVRTIDRSKINHALTPQGFRTKDLLKAYQKAFEENVTTTDEASVIEKFSDVKIKCVICQGDNTKITTINDIK